MGPSCEITAIPAEVDILSVVTLQIRADGAAQILHARIRQLGFGDAADIKHELRLKQPLAQAGHKVRAAGNDLDPAAMLWRASRGKRIDRRRDVHISGPAREARPGRKISGRHNCSLHGRASRWSDDGDACSTT